MLHLIADGLSVNARRRLQFQAHVAFIDGEKNFDFLSVLLNISCLESSLYPDSTSIREKVTDLITNQIQYPLHIVSIDEVRLEE